jgi:hypothetical protein
MMRSSVLFMISAVASKKGFGKRKKDLFDEV